MGKELTPAEIANITRRRDRAQALADDRSKSETDREVGWAWAEHHNEVLRRGQK